MLTAFQPYLNNARAKKADFDLLPDELFVLAKALVNKAKEGKATPAELILVSIIKDIQAFLNSSPEDSTDDSQNNLEREVTKNEVERLLERLLNAMPELRDLDNLDEAGFNHSTIMMIRSKVSTTDVPITAAKMTDS